MARKKWRKKGEPARAGLLHELPPIDVMAHNMPFDVRVKLAIQLEAEYRAAYLVAVAGNSPQDIRHAWSDWTQAYNNLAQLKQACEAIAKGEQQ